MSAITADIRPRLRLIAPQTFWLSLCFSIFNMTVGYAVYNELILYKLQLLGAVPLRIWGLIFLGHGLCLLASLALNNWRVTKTLHLIGIFMKATWLFESMAAMISGQSAFPLYVWSLLTTIQIVIYVYFTPRSGRAK
jgi:hypothetical protein